MKVEAMGNDKSSAPALDKGIQILEKVAAAGKDGIGFNRIVEELSLPESSAARYIKVLSEYEYLTKNPVTGLYHTGPGLARLGTVNDDPMLEILKQKFRAALVSIARRTGNTTVGFYWDGGVWHCVDKEMMEQSVVMQKPGEVRHDILNYPWGAFVYHDFSATRKELELKNYSDAEDKRNLMESSYREFTEKGYIYSPDKIYKRITVPFYYKDKFVGVIAVGGTIDSIADDKVEEYGKFIVDYAAMFSDELNEDFKR